MSEGKEQASGNWFAKHKVLTVIGVFVALLIIGSALGNNDSNLQIIPNSNSDTPQSATQEDEQETSAEEKLTIKNSTYMEDSGLSQVLGEVTNNDSKTHTATLTATFYDINGKILGTASGAVNEVAPGQTKTFTLVSTDNVSGYKEMKVQVDTLL